MPCSVHTLLSSPFACFSPFCVEEASGAMAHPEHHDPANLSGAAAPDKQFLGEQHTGVWIQLWSPSEGEAHLPKQGLLLLWPQIFLAIKETGFFLLKKFWKN